MTYYKYSQKLIDLIRASRKPIFVLLSFLQVSHTNTGGAGPFQVEAVSYCAALKCCKVINLDKIHSFFTIISLQNVKQKHDVHANSMFSSLCSIHT